MRGGYRDAKQAGQQQAERRREVRCKTLVFFQLNHVHPHGLDDLLAADAGAQTHDSTAQQHQPDRDDHPADAGLPVAEGHAQEQYADEFLAILRAVHKAHGRRAEDLRVAEEAVCLAAVQPGAHPSQQLADEPAGAEAQQQAHDKTVEDLDPLGPVDATQTVVDGDGRAGQAGDQAVALAGGDAEPGSRDAVYHDGKQRRAQRDEGFVGVAAEVHHVGDGGSDGGVDAGHDQHTEKVEPGAEQDGRTDPHAAGADAGSDGVGGVGPSVDEDDAQRERHGHQQNGVGGHLLEKMRQRYIHVRVSLVFFSFLFFLFFDCKGGCSAQRCVGGVRPHGYYHNRSADILQRNFT